MSKVSVFLEFKEFRYCVERIQPLRDKYEKTLITPLSTQNYFKILLSNI